MTLTSIAGNASPADQTAKPPAANTTGQTTQHVIVAGNYLYGGGNGARLEAGNFAIPLSNTTPSGFTISHNLCVFSSDSGTNQGFAFATNNTAQLQSVRKQPHSRRE